MKTTQSAESTSESTAKTITKPKPLRTVSGLDKPVVAVAEEVIVKPVAKKTVKVAATTPIKTTAHTKVFVAAKPDVAKVEPTKMPVSIQIWNAIKDRELGLFGLSDQTVVKYCTPMDLDPNKCMLKYKVSSVIPALEEAVRRDFDFEVQSNYIVISKKSKQ